MLKLDELKNEVLSRIEKIDKKKLVNYANELYASKNYNSFMVRFANDIKSMCFKSSEICEWYDKYNCNDTHITNLFMTVLRKYVRDNNLDIKLQ